eukprot:2598070-Amphidinium_carterae.1
MNCCWSDSCEWSLRTPARSTLRSAHAAPRVHLFRESLLLSPLQDLCAAAVACARIAESAGNEGQSRTLRCTARTLKCSCKSLKGRERFEDALEAKLHPLLWRTRGSGSASIEVRVVECGCLKELMS